MPDPTPHPHRLARAMAAGGWRFAPAAWAVAERIARAPAHPTVRLSPGVEMPVDLSDWISANIYRGLYERAELRLLPRLLTSGGTAVDVGANRGLYTAIMAHLVGPTGRVVAFEPNPRCVDDVRGLVDRAGFANVTILQCAVAQTDGMASLHDVEAGHAGLATLREIPEASGTTYEVPTRRLDGVAELGDAELQLVKVDVEGFEEHVLAGTSGLLASRRIQAMLLEVSPQLGSVAFLDELLADLGTDYEGFRVAERGFLRRCTTLRPVPPGQAAGDGTQYNLLLLRRDRSPAVEGLVEGR
jgi:FkbM family methyltransferase